MERGRIEIDRVGLRHVSLIDFERAETSLAVRDLARLEYGAWDGRPFLRDAFMEGYGRALTEDEESALRDLAALDAASAVQWGAANNDTSIMRRAYRALARLQSAAADTVHEHDGAATAHAWPDTQTGHDDQ
jgi:hypothetical protein